jgi:chromate reductase
MPSPRILAFAGSLRTGSYNKRLVRVAAEAARADGAEVTALDIRDFPLPLFDQDLEQEQGQPENARVLQQLFAAHEGLLIAAPEYNTSITAALKNLIDWVSRPVEGQPSLFAFRGKTAALLSASPGALGGLRGLVHARAILSGLGVLVLPEQYAVSRAHEAFDDQGMLKDLAQGEAVKAVARRLVTVTRKLGS